MKCATKKRFKAAGVFALCLVGLILLTAVSYVLYVIFQYSRIPDNQTLEVRGEASPVLDESKRFSIMTYNMGFGAYSPEYSFFMDYGEMADGKKVSGKYGKGIDKADVQKNTDGSVDIVKDQGCDFVFLQEVDEKAGRSYKINQLEAMRGISGYQSVYGENFHSAYLFYPFHDPHGASNAGLVTLSKYNLDASTRRSYPVSTGFSKFLDLDRAFTVSRIDLKDGKQLVLMNSHMSAYDSGGTIRKQQLEMLNGVMKEEYEKGNYVIVGGDFNHDIADSEKLFPSQQKHPDWVFEIKPEDLTEGYKIAAAVNAPTCRSADIPYEKGVNYTVVIDGFFVSDNVKVEEVVNLDYDFKYSDHNPVKLTFSFIK